MMMVQKETRYRLIYDTLRWTWHDVHGVGKDGCSNINYTFAIDGEGPRSA